MFMFIKLNKYQDYEYAFEIINKVEQFLQEAGYKDDDIVEVGYDELGFPQIILLDNSRIRFHRGLIDNRYDGFHVMEIEKKYDDAMLYTQISHYDKAIIPDEIMSLFENKDGIYISIYRPIEIEDNKINYYVNSLMPTYFYSRDDLKVNSDTSIINDIILRTEDLNLGYNVKETIGKKYNCTKVTNNQVPDVFVSPLSKSVLIKDLVGAAITANNFADKLVNEKNK